MSRGFSPNFCSSSRSIICRFVEIVCHRSALAAFSRSFILSNASCKSPVVKVMRDENHLLRKLCKTMRVNTYREYIFVLLTHRFDVLLQQFYHSIFLFLHFFFLLFLLLELLLCCFYSYNNIISYEYCDVVFTVILLAGVLILKLYPI